MWHKGHEMTKDASVTRILCTGASGALGGALASLHAAPGVHLSLWGRDRTRLGLIAEKVSHAGAEAQASR